MEHDQYRGAMIPAEQLGRSAYDRSTAPQRETVNTALERIDRCLNELADIDQRLTALADRIGGPAGGNAQEGGVNPTSPSLVGSASYLADSLNRAVGKLAMQAGRIENALG